MNDERAYLLERCLRLEARLLGIALPECQDELPTPAVPLHQRRIRRNVTADNVTADEVAQMRSLRRRGVSYYEIGAGWGVRRGRRDSMPGM